MSQSDLFLTLLSDGNHVAHTGRSKGEFGRSGRGEGVGLDVEFRHILTGFEFAVDGADGEPSRI